MKKRLKEFEADVKALTIYDLQSPGAFNNWLNEYVTYLIHGGVKPKPKPTIP